MSARFVWLTAAALLSFGCMQPAPIVPERTERKRTFAAPRVNIVVSADMSTFKTDHFALIYGSDMEEHPDFQTPEDRISFARGQLVQLEAFYLFLNETFGFEIADLANVVVSRTVGQPIAGGFSIPAYATSSDPDYGGRPTAHFSPESASQMSTLIHEVAHLLDYMYIGKRAPVWFAEGLATLVENDFIGGNNARREEPLLDGAGQNVIQAWGSYRRRGSMLPGNLEGEAYNHAYHIMKTLHERFGDVFYTRLFVAMRGASQREFSDESLVDLMSAVSGADLRPLFTDQFRFQFKEKENE